MAKGVIPMTLPGLPEDFRYLAHIAGSRNPGFIYFLISESLALVKIGASNRWVGHQVAVDRRIQEVKNDAPMIPINRELVILAASLGRTETEIHRHFSEYRIGGEWFSYTDDLKAFVECVDRFLQQLEKWSEPDSPAPTEFPWKVLDKLAKPPTKKFVGLDARFQ